MCTYFPSSSSLHPFCVVVFICLPDAGCRTRKDNQFFFYFFKNSHVIARHYNLQLIQNNLRSNVHTYTDLHTLNTFVYTHIYVYTLLYIHTLNVFIYTHLPSVWFWVVRVRFLCLSIKGEVCLRVRSQASLCLHMTLRHNKEGTVRFVF